MNKIIIFGNGDIAQIANYYFHIDSGFEVVAFTVDSAFIQKDTFEGLPVLPFENIEKIYSPVDYSMFVAISYAQLNELRERKFNEALSKGYHLPGYISSRCSYLSQFSPGKNCFIFEDNTIQPFVKIGDNVTLWSGNHIGHHSTIEDHVFVSSHVVISGHCHIGSHSFLGVNSTMHNNVTIGKRNILGAGSVITHNTKDNQVWVPSKSFLHPKTSNEIKM